MDGSEGSCRPGMDATNTESSLVSFVTEESEDRPFWVVYGKEGLGKTTLVQKVYNKPEVRHKFKGCAWINVTPHLQYKTIWKDILSQIDYRRKDDKLEALPAYQALVLRLQSALQSNKYLIVLDGICSMEAMLNDMLADKMPSKVAITTRDQTETEKIVKERGRYLEMMSPLTEPQSWQLFLKTQLDRHPSPSEDFERELENIYRKCEGVPLAVKLLGNLMAWKERIDWNELRQQSCVSAEYLMELSYSLLREHQKTCLHYLALSPADIEADKLCNLWIAEKMTTTPQQAETYLNELATLGLVEVQEDETKSKSCSLPHYVRDFCCGKAKEESLIAKEESLFATAAFYFDKRVGEYEFPLKPKKKTTLEEVQSILLLMNTSEQHHHILSPKPLDLTNCKLLRALDFNWLDFHAIEFPQHINKLAHLSYLSFRDCYLEELPQSIQELKSLETLDLRVRVNPEVVYKMRKSDVLCQLKRLRSLYLPYEFEKFPDDEKLELDCLSELENLQNFVSTHCRANDLSSLIKLRYLAATIVDVKDLEEVIECLKKGTSKSSSIHLEIIDFRSPRGAFALSNLLACGSLNALHLHGQIDNLPLPISDKLTEFFLIDSELEEDPMPLLGDLRKLQKLGLSNNAFVGDQIICRESGFPQLRYLKLSNLPDLKNWTLEETAMPYLSTLTIENCVKLETLPDGLRTHRHLQELSILKMPERFRKKYNGTQGEDFNKIQHVLSIKITGAPSH